MLSSKSRLQRDLLKSLEKVVIDRPMILEEKANLIIKEDESFLESSHISASKTNRTKYGVDMVNMSVSNGGGISPHINLQGNKNNNCTSA